MNPQDKASEARVAELTNSFKASAQAATERAKDEQHVKKLTADNVAQQSSNTAHNLMLVAAGKNNDPTIRERAMKELKRFRHEPEVAALFTRLEKEEADRVLKARVLALKRGGFLKKIGGDNV